MEGKKEGKKEKKIRKKKNEESLKVPVSRLGKSTLAKLILLTVTA